MKKTIKQKINMCTVSIYYDQMIKYTKHNQTKNENNKHTHTRIQQSHAHTRTQRKTKSE